MKIKYFVILLFTTMLLSAQKKSDFKLKVGDDFPKFKLKTADGDYVTSEDIEGSVVFFNLWFIRCKPCRDEIPELNKLTEIYGRDVIFISATFEHKDDVNKFLNQNDFFFDYMAVEASSFLKNQIGNVSYPKNIIIDEWGTVRVIKKGLPYKTVVTLDEKVVKDKADYKYFARYLDDILEY